MPRRYRGSEGKRLSAMLRGNKRFTCKDYTAIEEAYGTCIQQRPVAICGFFVPNIRTLTTALVVVYVSLAIIDEFVTALPKP